MDSIGTSYKAANHGIAANPRVGAPIELTALVKCCLDFIINMNDKGLYPYTGV